MSNTINCLTKEVKKQLGRVLENKLKVIENEELHGEVADFLGVLDRIPDCAGSPDRSKTAWFKKRDAERSELVKLGGIARLPPPTE